MPAFSNSVPSDEKHMAFELIRTPQDRPLVAVVTSEDLIGCYTHFWGHRTVPCEQPDCPACIAGMPFRWHAYLTALESKTRRHFLFECTANAAKEFEIYREANGTLRGCLFNALRPKRGRNSKVEITTKPADLTRIVLPEPPNIVKALCTIWQIPSTAVEEGSGHNGTPTPVVNSDVTSKVKEHEPNQPSQNRKPKDQTS